MLINRWSLSLLSSFFVKWWRQMWRKTSLTLRILRNGGNKTKPLKFCGVWSKYCILFLYSLCFVAWLVCCSPKHCLSKPKSTLHDTTFHLYFLWLEVHHPNPALCNVLYGCRRLARFMSLPSSRNLWRQPVSWGMQSGIRHILLIMILNIFSNLERLMNCDQDSRCFQ